MNNVFTTLTLKRENQRKHVVVLQYREPRQKFIKKKLCIWWDPLSLIYYELLISNETITGVLYPAQFIRLKPALNEKSNFIIIGRRSKLLGSPPHPLDIVSSNDYLSL